MSWLIILNLVKLIALTLFWLLAALIIVLLIILFTPVRYRGTASINYTKNRDPEADSKIFVDVRATWLLRIFTFLYNIEAGETHTSLKCFGKNLPGGGKDKKNPPNPPSDEEEGEQRKTDEKPPPDSKSSIAAEQDLSDYGSSAETIEESLDNVEHDNDGSEPFEKQSFTKKLNNIIEKVNHYIESASNLLHYPDKDLIIQQGFRCLKRLCRGLRPDHLAVDGVLGFQDPSITGVTLGAICAVAALLGVMEQVRVKSNFEEQVILFEIRIKGKITLWAVIWPLVLCVLSKPIWKIVKAAIKGRRKDGRRDEEREMHE